MVFFVIGQFFLKLMDAATELRSLISEIDADLTLYVADRTVAPGKERYLIFRRHGGRLNAVACKVVWYPVFKKLFQLPPQKDVLKAARRLLDLAIDDADFDEDVSAGGSASKIRKEIRELLGLKSPYAEQ